MQTIDTFFVDDEKISWPPPLPSALARGEALREANGGERLDSGRFLAALLHEVETTGIFIAAASSVVSFAARYPHRARAALLELPTWLPAPPQLLGKGPELLVRLAVPMTIVNRLNDLPIHLGIACDVTRRHCSALAQDHPVSPAAIDDLVALWSAVAEGTVALLQELAPTVGNSAEPGAAVSAERLLVAAALGASPCVSAAGAIEIPGWIERRRDRRHRLRLQGSLVVGDRDWRIETTDISQHGAGLAGLPQLPVGSRARLVLDNLAEAVGTIVWYTGDRGGIRFDSPLAALDRLARTFNA